MHYSDCFELVKKLKDKVFAEKLQRELETVEKLANSPTFTEFVKDDKSTKSLLVLRREYDLARLQAVKKGIRTILDTYFAENEHEIKTVLLHIKEAIKQRTKNYEELVNYTHYSDLAQKYATHYLPFNHLSDPFKGPTPVDYGWGHSQHYADLASRTELDSLTTASNKRIHTFAQSSHSLADIFFRRVGRYSVDEEVKVRNAIWKSLKALDDKAILDMTITMGTNSHSMAIRMVNEGVEFYDHNYGLVRFQNREKAVSFITAHLTHISTTAKEEISVIETYKLPYTNNHGHQIVSDLDKSRIPVPVVSKAEDEKPPVQPNVSEAIDALENYATSLKKSSDIKAKIKANELDFLAKELNELISAGAIQERVGAILQNKDHSLMVNRGTGFYFFKSGFKSHSTTETLLQNIHKAATPS
ncbi:YopT-type cysteine protease domain-containing protein [Legionella hackeliae]|uniref:Uncharacterized protein n=1 Tax=Legionella hackeliae TaxID=449 RepID=A0A0A8US57_LEGHA|nr:YopT-type cysteine protease domain-containing protein [Legionella hackeliae]KTD14161.1 hypothetical protein Lhac_0473 [Legionella hackeliae]CEK10366.1 protein of unknown function [Legionella hackeliae]STX47102.1 Uncharacterised protein [Legionella hackeliae]